MTWGDEIYEAYLAKHPEKQARYAPESTIYGQAVSDNGEADKGPEKDLQSKCEAYLDEKGWPWFHDRSKKVNKPGLPDLLIWMPGGRQVSIELKTKTERMGKMSPEQKDWAKALLYLGHEWHEVKSYRRFVEIMQGGK